MGQRKPSLMIINSKIGILLKIDTSQNIVFKVIMTLKHLFWPHKYYLYSGMKSSRFSHKTIDMMELWTGRKNDIYPTKNLETNPKKNTHTCSLITINLQSLLFISLMVWNVNHMYCQIFEPPIYHLLPYEICISWKY